MGRPEGIRKQPRAPLPASKRVLARQSMVPRFAGAKGEVLIMPRMRTVLTGLLIVLATGSMAVCAASAAVQGPFWMEKERTGQVKIEPKDHLQIKGQNKGTFLLKSKIVAIPVFFECRNVENKGSIWNGPHAGRGEATVKWTECFVSTSTPICKGFPVEVGAIKVRTQLMWKYKGSIGELGEAGGQQKIYDVFAPTAAIEEFEMGQFRAFFTFIEIPREVAGMKCAIGGVFALYARGKRYPGWENQEGTKQEVQWGTAAQVEPQNMDAKSGTLKWVFPNAPELHVEGGEQEAVLRLEGAPAELQGTIQVEAGMPEFGAWNEV